MDKWAHRDAIVTVVAQKVHFWQINKSGHNIWFPHRFTTLTHAPVNKDAVWKYRYSPSTSPCPDTPKEGRGVLAAPDESAPWGRFPQPSRHGDVGRCFCQGWSCTATSELRGIPVPPKRQRVWTWNYEAGQDPVLLDLAQDGVGTGCVEDTHLTPTSVIPKAVCP